MPIYGDWHILISTFAGRSQRRCCHEMTNQCVLTTFQREQLYGLSHDRDMTLKLSCYSMLVIIAHYTDKTCKLLG